MRKIAAFEVAGAVFIILLGSALHFTYALSGNYPFVGIFSAVNESVWEHLKLAFWPSILWILIELYSLRKNASSFFASKTIGTYVMVFFIPAVFYTYTLFTGESLFLIDIAAFIIAILIGQTVSCMLLQRDIFPKWIEKVSVILLVLLAIIFVAFTFYPPHFPLFQDSISGQYGI